MEGRDHSDITATVQSQSFLLVHGLIEESYHTESTYEKRRGAVHMLLLLAKCSRSKSSVAITAAIPGRLIPPEPEQTKASHTLRTNQTVCRMEDKVRPMLCDPSYQPTYDEKRLAVLILGIRARVLPLKNNGAGEEQPYRVKIEVAPANILSLFSEHSMNTPL